MTYILVYYFIHYVFYNRGETFRRVMSQVGDVRSLLPSHVTMLALTATATSQLRLKVTQMLGLKDKCVVSLSPCKANILYAVNKFQSIPETFQSHARSTLSPKTKIFLSRLFTVVAIKIVRICTTFLETL